MAVEFTRQDITSGYNLTSVNANFEAIEEALQDAFSLNGTAPNTVLAQLDMNSNDIINANIIYAEDVIVDGMTIVGSGFADAASASADEAAASAVAALASAEDAQVSADLAADGVFVWRGLWVATTVYAVNDLAQESGTTYICLVAHTSGTFSTDLSALKWSVFAQKGTNGAGTGDVLAANNGSDFTNMATFRANTGTQAVDTTLTSLSALGTAADKYAYTTGVDTWAEGAAPSYGRSLVAAASAAAARGVLVLGTSALLDTGVLQGAIPIIGVGNKITESILPTGFGWEYVETTYDNSVDGDVASVETSVLTGDFEYMVEISYLSHNSGISRELRADLYGETLAAYTTGNAALTGAVSSGINTHGLICFPTLRRSKVRHYVQNNLITGSVPIADSGNSLSVATVYRPVWSFTVAQKSSRIRFKYSAGNIDAGLIQLYRRRIIV